MFLRRIFRTRHDAPRHEEMPPPRGDGWSLESGLVRFGAAGGAGSRQRGDESQNQTRTQRIVWFHVSVRNRVLGVFRGRPDQSGVASAVRTIEQRGAGSFSARWDVLANGAQPGAGFTRPRRPLLLEGTPAAERLGRVLW